ncbi:MAG: prolipoprotein diacylglyceryl transferase [Proteobacteria bacterium]|nr:MAG: prolipoprotein diacylglyceryl transferase [Pseudomonadota bacterium]
MLAFLHHFDPYAVQIGDQYGVRWYGLSYLAGFLATYWFILWLIRRGRSPLSKTQAGDAVFWLAIATVLGGRLGYCLMYDPALFIYFDDSFPFWGALAINRGGMSAHGGIAGVLLTCYLYGRKHKLPALHLADICATSGAIGIFFGRIANFINGELVGRPCDPNLPWAVKFPQDILAWPEYEPQRLKDLAQAVQLLGESSTTWLDKVASNPLSGYVQHHLMKIVSAVQEGNHAVAEALQRVLLPRHPSQLYEAGMEGLLLFLACAAIWRRPRSPGLVSICFLTLYPLVRFVGEQFRMPDAQIGYQLLGLTRGQWLSLFMLLVVMAGLKLLRRPARRS